MQLRSSHTRNQFLLQKINVFIFIGTLPFSSLPSYLPLVHADSQCMLPPHAPQNAPNVCVCVCTPLHLPSPLKAFTCSPLRHFPNSIADLSAGVVWAWDADDEEEGTNAILTYSIDKNVVDERSGEAIFDIDPKSGLVRTAVCCLDRETTPEYHIQVVATDGGGLKGEAGSWKG